ncbi:MAG: ATP-binding cassette domain-containing protein [Planctomycetota bacterium]|jgi:PAS domain S-box-containing protein|nr:ATP-binding cassette domain-containing protein [Planctomycetota bacterium]
MGWNNPDPNGWVGVRNVSLRFGHISALTSVDFRISQGEFHVLAGSHNDGKSSLCRIMAGLIGAASGEIVIDGAAQARYGVREASTLGIEYSAATADIFPHLSALENIVVGSYGARGRFFAHATRHRRKELREWLAGFGLAEPERAAAAFSFEDRLLIRVLGCLYKNPRLLILDETLEQFTLSRRAALLREIAGRREKGMSVLWATHKLDDALEIADRITIIRNGRGYLTVPAADIDRRSLIRMTYSSTQDYPGDSRDDFEDYHNLIRYSEVLLENLPSAVMILDTAERIRFMNAGGLRLLGLTGKYHIGMPVARALGEKNARFMELVRTMLATRTGGSIPGASFRTERGTILVDARILTVVDNMDRPAAMLILDDVSEREAMRQQLTIAHNLSSIGMLAAGVAHEVNNPLESIGNYISYLLRRIGDVETKRILENVRLEAGHIHDIVTNLAVFSGKGEEKARDVDLAEMIREIVHMLGFNAKYDAIEIDCVFPERPLVLRIDPNELRQIILNLVRNGMEAMPEGGSISLEADEIVPRMARVRVRDYGPGLFLEPERAGDIFLPFVSGKNGCAGNQGLGLSIVYGLVKKWGGRISVEPVEPGVRFTVELPLAEKGVV